jgi:hypothetical protein
MCQPRQLLRLSYLSIFPPAIILQLSSCLRTPSSLQITQRATRDLLSRSHSNSRILHYSSVRTETHKTSPIMASATSFYDFEPADSTFFFYYIYNLSYLPSIHPTRPLPCLLIRVRGLHLCLLLITQMAFLCRVLH